MRSGKRALYNGIEFETLSVGNHSIEENRISLFTMSVQDAIKFAFYKKEQFVFEKDVNLDEIEALFQMKKPIRTFKDLPVIRDLIAKEKIREYIKSLDFY
ncbi:hypothetical protein ACFFIX_16990 [Metabacillus herbersteinensis]|uniref:Uncharacterized protein n=1 Tax=Metabacillus herbersteinensis TaxID=283816 RepID=A0ABV6GHW5_9BACI